MGRLTGTASCFLMTTMTSLNLTRTIYLVSRAWIVSNWVCAKYLTFRWGPHEMDAHEFCSALEIYELHSHPNLIKHPRARTLATSERIRQRYHAGENHQSLLLAVVKMVYPLQVTSALDRIFAALVPITPSDTLGAFRLPDYSLPLVDAFTKMARLLNGVEPNTPFISMSLAGNTMRPGVHRGEAEGLPTWVPDWSDPQELDIFHMNEAASVFCAWRGHVAITPEWHGPRTEHTHLFGFRAALIDRVDQISSYQPPRRPADRLNVAAMNSLFFSEWWDWVRQKTPDRYKGDEDRCVQKAPPLPARKIHSSVVY